MRIGILSALIYLLIFYGKSFAQNEFKGGAVVGLSASQVHGDTYSGFDKAGLYAGGFVKRNLTEKWSAQLELAYIQKGSRKNPNPENGDYVFYLLKIDYVEIPFVVQWHYKHLSFEAGMAYAALINNREENEFGVVNNIFPLQRSDISFLLGLNYKIGEHFTVNIRNSNSILPVRKFNAPIYYQRRLSNMFNRGMYNNVMILALQYQF